MTTYDEVIESNGYDEDTGIYSYDNYDDVLTDRDLKNVVDDYLVNSFDFPFDYKGNIFFGEGIYEGNIYLCADKIDINTTEEDCIKNDDDEPIVFMSYDYEKIENGNIVISFSQELNNASLYRDE